MNGAHASRWPVWRAGAALAASLALAGCGMGEKRDDPPVSREAPTVAPSMPLTIADPGATAALRSFAGRDADRDGWISGAENATAEARIFQAIDADQDGSVSARELDAARLALGLVTLPGSEDIIARADQDGDGKLTLAEWIAHEGQTFKAADTDGDGRLSRREYAVQPRLDKIVPHTPAAISAEASAGIG
ncbi:MAG: hypothetical protein M0R03_00740 [Novosphingobium sp.]|nr:hypothetical protein [Novosphingobium sp.]